MSKTIPLYSNMSRDRAKSSFIFLDFTIMIPLFGGEEMKIRTLNDVSVNNVGTSASLSDKYRR